MEGPSRKKRRRVERQSRREQRRTKREKRKTTHRLERLFLSLIGAVLVAGAGYWAYGKWSGSPTGRFVPSLGNRHIASSEVGLITYNSDPPTSGPHLPTIARWGIHESPVQKELQVHNLEDGGVIVQYNCQRADPDCKELVDRLGRIVRTYDHVLLAPYPGMKHRITLTAWSRIDEFDDFDEQRIVRFIDAYIDIDHHPRRGR